MKISFFHSVYGTLLSIDLERDDTQTFHLNGNANSPAYLNIHNMTREQIKDLRDVCDKELAGLSEVAEAVSANA